MKKHFVIYMTLILALTLSACSKSAEKQDLSEWDCTVTCAENSGSNAYVVSYSNEDIISDSGMLSFQNQNSFDIVVHLLTDGEDERTMEVKAGGVGVLYQLAKDAAYTVGCHAEVDEGTEIKLKVYDGERTEVY